MIFGTVGLVGAETGTDEAVLRGGLPMQEHATGRKVEREDCIAGFRWRVRIAVSGCDIERPALAIDGRGGPHRRAGRTIKLGPDCVARFRRRGVWEGVSL